MRVDGRVTSVAIGCALALGGGCGRESRRAEPAIAAAPATAVALEAEPSTDRGEAPAIRFAWGTPCRVPARQQVTKKGKDATLTFDVVVEARAERLAVRLERMAFASFDGKDASDPTVAKRVAPALAVAAVPTFIVSSEGDYLGTEDVAATVDALVKTLPTDPTTERVVTMMRSPEMMAMMERAAGDHWNSWVGAWVGWDVPPGEPEEVTEQVELVPGVAAPQTVTRETLGAVKGAPSLRLLRVRQVIEGPAATRAMLAVLEHMADQAGGPPIPADAIQRFRRETTVTVAFEPATARPHRARHEVVTEVDDRREVELRDTTFEWGRAIGCVVAPQSTD